MRGFRDARCQWREHHGRRRRVGRGEARQPLEGAKALVLAATGPVGQRVARLFAREGAHVRLASRSLERSQVVSAILSGQIPQGSLEAVGTTSVSEITAAVAAIVSLRQARPGLNFAHGSLEHRRRGESSDRFKRRAPGGHCRHSSHGSWCGGATAWCAYGAFGAEAQK